MSVEEKLDEIAAIEVKAERLAALRELDRVVPDHPDVLLELGKALLRTDLDAAEETLRRSRELDDDGWASLYLGNLFLRRDELDRADEEFARAERRMPDNPAPVWCRADMAWERDCLSEAEDRYRRSVLLDPNDPVPIVKLARFLIMTGRMEEGRALLRRALEIEPDYDVALRLLGTLQP